MKDEITHQPLPWHASDIGMPELYDASGDFVTALGNDFNSIAGDRENMKLILEAVNNHEELKAEVSRLRLVADERKKLLESAQRKMHEAQEEASRLRNILIENEIDPDEGLYCPEAGCEHCPDSRDCVNSTAEKCD